MLTAHAAAAPAGGEQQQQAAQASAAHVRSSRLRRNIPNALLGAFWFFGGKKSEETAIQ